MRQLFNDRHLQALLTSYPKNIKQIKIKKTASEIVLAFTW